MPFQISLHSNVKSRGVINSFNAGNDQYATCASEIILTATVDGNLGGHTIRWEQMSGDTQIVWLTPTNQLSATFAIVGGGSSDRTFRFYIDKGTPLEQFDDVTAWGTPTETDSYVASNTPTPTNLDVACRNIPCSSINLVRTYGVTPATYPGVVVVNPQFTYDFTWTPPTCDSQYLTSIEIVRNNGGVLQSSGLLPPTTTSYTITNTTDAYYFYTNYIVKGIDSTQFSCRYYEPLDVQPTAAYVDEKSVAASTLQSVTTTYYELTSQSPIVDDRYLPNTMNSVIATYYEPTTQTPVEDPSSVASVINTLTIVYYSNNGIGG